jgi:hypothetical protein
VTEGYRAFMAKREERVRVLLGAPMDEGFRLADVRMYTKADCECRGSGVLQDLKPAGRGSMVMTLTECQCVRYQRIDVKR